METLKAIAAGVLGFAFLWFFTDMVAFAAEGGHKLYAWCGFMFFISIAGVAAWWKLGKQ